MTKIKLLLIALLFSSASLFSQGNEGISTIEFIKVLNDNNDEAWYYYKNNWEQLRITAVDNGYIKSYKLLKILETNSEANIILQTTYKNKEQFDKRESHFKELIEAHGNLRLLNNKQPNQFRKTLFWSDSSF